MSKKNKEKSTLLIWLEFVPFLLLYGFVRILPLKLAYSANKFLFSLLYCIDPKHRNRTINHIVHAEITTSRKKAKQMARASFISFAKLLVEIIKYDQYYSSNKTTFTGSQTTIDKVLNPAGNNRNVILVTAHYGNWEMAGTAFSERSGIPMASIMRPFGNPLIGKLILKKRASSTHEMINKQGGIKNILRALRQNKIATFLVDQHASTKDGGIETTFFGQPCRTHSAPALLHLKTGVPIMPEITRRVDDNFNFELIVGDLIEYKPTGNKEEDLKNITQLYTTALENLIKQEPEQWMWAHRRWTNINRN